MREKDDESDTGSVVQNEPSHGRERQAASELRIVVVGPCAAGKSTLVGNLRPKGYTIRTCAQEHSHVPKLWLKYCRADVLIYLDASLETIGRRQQRSDWTHSRLEEQRSRLADAKRHCDLYLCTDDLSREQVAASVESFLVQSGIRPVGK